MDYAEQLLAPGMPPLDEIKDLKVRSLISRARTVQEQYDSADVVFVSSSGQLVVGYSPQGECQHLFGFAWVYHIISYLMVCHNEENQDQA